MALSERARYAIEEAVFLAVEDGAIGVEIEAEFRLALEEAEAEND